MSKRDKQKEKDKEREKEREKKTSSSNGAVRRSAKGVKRKAELEGSPRKAKFKKVPKKSFAECQERVSKGGWTGACHSFTFIGEPAEYTMDICAKKGCGQGLKRERTDDDMVQCWGGHAAEEYDTVLHFKGVKVRDDADAKKQDYEINMQDKTIKKMAPGVTTEAYLKAEEQGTVATFWEEHFNLKSFECNAFVKHSTKEKGAFSITAHVEGEAE